MDLAKAKKIAVEMRGSRSSMAYTAWEQQRGPAYVMDWLIAEVERLTDAHDVQVEISRKFMAERDRYKLALEEIDGLYPTTNPPGVLVARGIARTALQK